MKQNKYNYLVVIQGYYATGYGWEDVSEYDNTPQGRKDARQDIKEYRLSGPYAFRLINRRELKQVQNEDQSRN